MRFSEFVGRYIRVRTCPGCATRISYEREKEAFCPDCREKWDKAKTESCESCFQAYCECVCMTKSLEKAGALSLRKLVRYSAKRQAEPQNKILYTLKHKPNKRLSGFLADELLPLLWEELRAVGIEDASEARIVFIPRGRRSYVKYGTDQSEEIGISLSEKSGIPMARIFHRKWGGREQKHLHVAERQKNLKGLLSVSAPEEIRGRVVILLDDVVTTGASMASCASLLKKAGAACVLCFCVAKTD